MTDEQIIKHIFGCENKDCRVIVIFNKPEDTIDEITIGDIADVINRQQAENNRQRAEIEKLQLSRKQKLKEIERLNVELVGMRGACNSYKMHYDNAKTEIERLKEENGKLLNKVCGKIRKESKAVEKLIKAETIKEFEAKIHEKLHEAEMHGNFEPVVTREMFDSVAKEVVGEGK